MTIIPSCRIVKLLLCRWVLYEEDMQSNNQITDFSFFSRTQLVMVGGGYAERISNKNIKNLSLGKIRRFFIKKIDEKIEF